ASEAAISSVRIVVWFAMKRLPSFSLFRCLGRGHAEAHDVDGAATGLIVRIGCVFFGVHDAAQRERQMTGLLAGRERFDLSRRQFERYRLADDDLLTVLVLDRLVDREDPHLGDDRLAGVALD